MTNAKVNDFHKVTAYMKEHGVHAAEACRQIGIKPARYHTAKFALENPGTTYYKKKTTKQPTVKVSKKTASKILDLTEVFTNQPAEKKLLLLVGTHTDLVRFAKEFTA